MSDVPVPANIEGSASPASFTPGPWRVEPGGFVGGPVGFGRVCQTWNKFEEDFTNAEANARLIAAAPSLLEALKDMRKRFFRCALNAGSEAEFVQLACGSADAAIAKATGGPE